MAQDSVDPPTPTDGGEPHREPVAQALLNPVFAGALLSTIFVLFLSGAILAIADPAWLGWGKHFGALLLAVAALFWRVNGITGVLVAAVAGIGLTTAIVFLPSFDFVDLTEASPIAAALVVGFAIMMVALIFGRPLPDANDDAGWNRWHDETKNDRAAVGVLAVALAASAVWFFSPLGWGFAAALSLLVATLGAPYLVDFIAGRSVAKQFLVGSLKLGADLEASGTRCWHVLGRTWPRDRGGRVLRRLVQDGFGTEPDGMRRRTGRVVFS